MEIQFSPGLMDDITKSIQSALAKHRIVNIPKLAEEIRKRNEVDNIALEDIATQLLTKAQLFNAAMEFDTSADGFGQTAN